MVTINECLLRKGTVSGCQFASNRDPLFAFNRDPSEGPGLGLSMEWIGGTGGRRGATRYADGDGGGRVDQLRFLNRQLVLPVSMMSQWWVKRSSMAVVILASLNTCGQSAKARLVVISSEVFS